MRGGQAQGNSQRDTKKDQMKLKKGQEETQNFTQKKNF